MSNYFSELFLNTGFAAAIWDASISESQVKPYFSVTGSGNFAAGLRIQRSDCFENVNKLELFLNGSWEILPGQPGNAAGEGWPARFLYERWELGNGKWEMAHRPITMDHRKV